MKTLKEIRSEWKEHKYQIIGTAILTVCSLALGFKGEWGIGYALLGAILGYDWWLIRKDEQTITKWARRQLPGWLDKILMIVLWLLVVKYGAAGDGWGASYWFTVGTINGHLNWDK